MLLLDPMSFKVSFWLNILESLPAWAYVSICILVKRAPVLPLSPKQDGYQLIVCSNKRSRKWKGEHPKTPSLTCHRSDSIPLCCGELGILTTFRSFKSSLMLNSHMKLNILSKFTNQIHCKESVLDLTAHLRLLGVCSWLFCHHTMWYLTILVISCAVGN